MVPSREEINYEIQAMTSHLASCMDDIIRTRVSVIDEATHRIGFILEKQKDRLCRLSEALMSGSTAWLSRLSDRLVSHSRVLKELDPKRVLSRGFSIVRSAGLVLTNVSTLEVGSPIQVQFATGSADAQVCRVNENGQQKLV